MIETNAILEFAEDLIHQKTETYCSELQRRILTAALQEERKTYDQLAEECGYSSRYVKQDVAPKLWLLISQAVGEKVNKANVRAALEAAMRNYASDHTAANQTSVNNFSENHLSESLTPESLSPKSLTSTQNQYIRGQYINEKERDFLASPNSTIIITPSHKDSTRPLGDSLSGTGPSGTGLSGNGLLGDSPLETGLSGKHHAANITTTDVKANILLVDDQPQNLKLLSDLLEEQGYEVQQAINGAIALQAVQANPPDLVLLDIHMPQMDGYTLCQYMKADAKTAAIPVIFISAIDEPWDKVKAFSAGGCDYITKPFKVVEVLARVENHLKFQQLQKALIAQNNRLQQANQALKQLAEIDEITQVACRRRFDEYLVDCWQQTEQARKSLTLLLVHVNNFSVYGEAENPQLGDHILHGIAQIIKQSVCETQNLVARYGTITFAILLPQQTKNEGKVIAKKLTETIQTFSPLHPNLQGTHQSAQSSFSIGVVSTNFANQALLYSNVEEFLAAGEKTLQTAKQTNSCVAG